MKYVISSASRRRRQMLAKTIEELILYARLNLSLKDEDVVFTRNTLLHEFNLLEPYQGEDIDEELIKSYTSPTLLLNELRNDVENISEEMVERVMSLLSPTPSLFLANFKEIYQESPEKACKYFYNLMRMNDYIKVDDIKKNEEWEYEGNNNTLDITINLSKPEKDNKDIAKLVGSVSTTYPKCNLCYENVGFYGGMGKPARSNIRVLPITLHQEPWFMQYSPYSYYNEHAIVINMKHVPMLNTKKTFYNLMDFLDLFPMYFIGSNSDLPIVGGSILNHEHYQGGLKEMPMMRSRDRYRLQRKDLKNIEISYLDWYNSCIKLVSNDKEKIADVAELIMKNFEEYDDPSIDLISHNEEERYSAVTPIARKVKDNYEIYIILRNNRTSKEYPDGIFHAHPEYHNIKKEGIGLIEAMGQFILPGRLKKELSLIEEILFDGTKPIREIVLENPSLEKHLDFINNLVRKYTRNNTKEASNAIVQYEVGKVCENILNNTGIFKPSIDGQLALFRFFRTLSFEVIYDE